MPERLHAVLRADSHQELAIAAEIFGAESRAARQNRSHC